MPIQHLHLHLLEAQEETPAPESCWMVLSPFLCVPCEKRFAAQVQLEEHVQLPLHSIAAATNTVSKNIIVARQEHLVTVRVHADWKEKLRLWAKLPFITHDSLKLKELALFPALSGVQTSAGSDQQSPSLPQLDFSSNLELDLLHAWYPQQRRKQHRHLVWLSPAARLNPAVI